MSFDQIVSTRHSAMNFIAEEKMTAEDFKKIFELTKLAPSSYNLQLTEYLVIIDEQKKERVKEDQQDN